MISDEFLNTDMQLEQARANVERRQREEAEAKAREQLSTVQVDVEDYDLPAMVEAKMPMDGTFANEFAKPGRKAAGRRDARDGTVMVGPEVEDPLLWPIGDTPQRSEFGIAMGGVGHAAKAVGETMAAGVYGFGRGVWNFSADVYEAFGGEGGYRPPSYEEIGGSPPTGAVDELSRNMVKFGLGYANAANALKGLMPTALPRSMAAGAATDVVVMDPKEESIYDAFANAFGAEQELATQFSVARLAEDDPLSARAFIGLEGLGVGAIVDTATFAARIGGEKATEFARALWLRHDELEQTAVEALSKARYTTASGLDPAQAGWLTVWMGARIMKGAKQLDSKLRSSAAGFGASEEQVTQAWNKAATLSQRARGDAMQQFAEEAPQRFGKEMARGARMRGIDEADWMQRATDSGLDEQAARDMWAEAVDDETLRRLDNITAAVPEFEDVRQYLSTEELSNLAGQHTRHAAEKVSQAFKVFDRVDVDHGVGAAMGGSAKRGWYKQSAQALRDVFGDEDAKRFAGLLAALSPQTSVESNLTNAVHVWANWVRAGRPRDEATILKIMGESVQGGKGEQSILPSWRANSFRALLADNVDDIRLSGPKVDSFMRNLQGNFEEVTNDTWMAHFADIAQKEFSGSLRGTDPGKMGGYLGMNAATRKIAAELSAATGEAWTPAEVQETIWSFTRALYEKRVSEGFAGRTAEELLGEIDVRDVADFGTLLDRDAKLHAALEGAGYAVPRTDVDRFGRGAGGPGGTPEEALRGDETASEGAAAVSRRVERLYKERARASAGREFRPATTGGPVSGRPPAGDEGRGYRTDPGGTGRLNSLSFGGQGRRLSATPAYRASLARVDLPAPDYFELNQRSKPRFRDALKAAREKGGWATKASVDLKRSYKDDRVFMIDSGEAGFAVAPTGEIHSVFSVSGDRGLIHSMLQTAVEQGGGTWLYAFDTVLPRMYGSSGFKPVARIAWDDAYAPKGWRYGDPLVHRFNRSRPDVVFSVFDPKFDELVRNNQGGTKVADFDAAMALVNKAGAVRGD